MTITDCGQIGEVSGSRKEGESDKAAEKPPKHHHLDGAIKAAMTDKLGIADEVEQAGAGEEEEEEEQEQAEPPPDFTNMTPTQKRLFELRQRMNHGRKQNDKVLRPAYSCSCILVSLALHKPNHHVSAPSLLPLCPPSPCLCACLCRRRRTRRCATIRPSRRKGSARNGRREA